MTQGSSGDGIAVVGMACVFPGAADLQRFAANIEAGVDAIGDVPAARWDPVFYDPDGDAVDRFYCRRGGFVDGLLDFDALGFGIMPVAAAGAEPDQLATLQVAADALRDAGYTDTELPRDRTGVVIGRGNYIGAGMTRLEQHVRTAEQLVTTLRDLLPDLGEDRLARVKAEFRARLPAYGPDTAIGLVPNLTASRIANRLDLHGPAYTIDAACASALIAVDRACTDLRAGRLDLALAGGVHLSHDVAFWSVFTQLGALSRSQVIRPLDRRADGLLIGEGLGVVVLKRQADAERDGDRIYAVIEGVGVASDGRGATIMQPSPDGQALALQRAWAQAGLDPASIGLVEAHGTATQVGDAAEVATLRAFFGAAEPGAERAVVGSVKSMIGHAMPAAGIAGLIKAALAVHRGVLPPTLHCEEPLAALGSTRFRTTGRAEPWGGKAARVAAVNAFGFGGINAHLVLREHGADRGRRPRVRDDAGLLWLARPTVAALLQALDEGAPSGGSGPCRLALVDPTATRRARARQVVARGRARRGRDGLWFSTGGLLAEGGKLAFLYPGVEASFEPRVADVARFFDLELPAGLDTRTVEGTALESQGAALIGTSRLLTDALARVGVRPDLVAGHSIGEWSGMISAGFIAPDDLDDFLGQLVPRSLQVPGVGFLSVGGGIERVRDAVGDLPGVVVSHDNCPHQVVLCGDEAALQTAAERLQAARIMAHLLPFRSGFHAPFFGPYLRPHRHHFERLPLQVPHTPLWSATTAAPYPDDLDDVRALAIRHLVEPVHFRALVEALYDDGVRAFVQVGPGSLVGFVSDTLRGQDHLAMSANETQRSGLAQLRRLCAALFVEGADVELAVFDPPARRGGMALSLGVPLVHVDTPLPRPASPTVDRALPATGRVGQGFAALHDEIDRSLSAVQAALSSGVGRSAHHRARGSTVAPSPSRAAAAEPRAETRRLSVADQPFLADHSLIPQPPGWPVLSDRNPVVPMTMSVRMMLDLAERCAPGRVAVEIEQIRAHRWMAVEPAIDLQLRAEPLDGDRVRVVLEGYAEATVRLAPAWPAAPKARPPALGEETPMDLSAAQLYSERWMFHGPAYQAVRRLDRIGSGGMTGQLLATRAEGALLDGAGQLFGYQVMRVTEHNRLAMPVRIDRIELFGPEPAPGDVLDCVVFCEPPGVREVRADLEVSRGGRVWARIHGWTDWRFETDDRLWPVMHQAEHHLFAVPRPDGSVLVDDRNRSSSSLDYLARRFLRTAAREHLATLSRDDASAWLYARIAACDAVRHRAWEAGKGPLFPVEVAMTEAAPGQLLGMLPDGGCYTVAVASRPGLAVAVAVEEGDALPSLDAGLLDEGGAQASPRSLKDAE